MKPWLEKAIPSTEENIPTPQSRGYVNPTGPNAIKTISRKAGLREALSKIRAHPLVKSAKASRAFGDFCIVVKFTDGITEYWGLKSPGAPEPDAKATNYFVIDRELFGKEIPVYHEFEVGPFAENREELLRYFIIQKRDIRKAGFCQVRFMVHELIDKLIKEGWSELKYPDIALKRDLDAVKRLDHKLLFKHQEFSIYPGKASGSLIVRHFLPCGDLAHPGRQTLKEAWRPSVLNQAINQNLRSRKDITRASIVHCVGTYEGRAIAGPKIPNVNIWSAIFKVLGTASVYDIDPHFGEKAIAAAALGIGYKSFSPNEHLSKMFSWLSHKNVPPDVTIITNAGPIDDQLLDNRLKSTAGIAVGIITNEQATRFKPTRSWPIRIEFLRIQTAKHMVAVFQK